MKGLKKYLLPILGAGISLISALFWVALRINHSGISKFLGADTNPSFLIMNLPVMVCVLAWIGAAFSLAGLKLWDKRRWPAVTGLVIGLVMTVAAVAVILFGAKDYLPFIMVHFWESMAVSGCILIFALVLYFPPRISFGLKTAILAVVVAVAVVIGYQLRPCEISRGAVVYAVEDEYQIVFSTSDSAIAWVEIGGVSYYDLFAGSMRSADTVHKITVPQQVLDEAGGYRICAKQMIYRGPFGGYTGPILSEDYSFRPVDATDGLNYYSLSDVHEGIDAAVQAASYGENLDFIVLLGDIVSMVETKSDAETSGLLAHRITGGEIPVIYARGNHEIKGEYAEELYKYVGSKDQQYSYWVTLSDSVFAVVLDMGEDHEDDWWEYYGTAQFDLYRQAQSDMMRQILVEKEYETYEYRMALCHIPVSYVDKNGYFEKFRNEWTELLNQLDVDIALSGHKHVLWPMIPGQVIPGEKLVYAEGYSGEAGKVEGGYLTDSTFPAILVGRQSLQQAGGAMGNGSDQYVGLMTSVDFSAGNQVSRYINCRGEVLSGYYPFAEESFTDIQTSIKRPGN